MPQPSDRTLVLKALSTAWKNEQELREDSGLTIPVINRQLVNLMDCGWVEREISRGDEQVSLLYRLNEVGAEAIAAHLAR